MPTVPRYQSRVQAAPIPGVRVGTGTPQGAFGAAASLDLSAPTALLAGVVDRQRQETDQIKLQDRDTQLATLHTDVETKVTQLKGLDALGAKQAAQEAWTKGVAEIDGTDDKASDQVKAAFRARAQTYWTRLYGTVEAHTAQQMDAHDTQSTTAALDLRVQGAAKDPSLAPQLAAEAKALATDRGRRLGYDAGQLADFQTQATSAVHLAAIDRLLTSGQDQAATSYYDAHKGEVRGEDGIKVEKALEEGSSRGESQRQADAILKAGGTLTEQVQKARLITNSRVRDLTEARLRQNDAEQKAAQRDQAEADMTSAGNLIDRAHSVTAIPPAMWARFTPSQKASLKSYADTTVPGADKRQTDLSTWVSLRTMAGNPETRDAFLKLDPMSYASKLSPADFKGIVELRDGLKKGDDRTMATLDDVGRHTGIISNTLHGIGMLIDPKTGKADKPEAAVIYRSVNDQVEALQQATKRKATDKEVQAITDELVTRHVVTSAPSIWDRFFVRDPETGPKRLFEMKPGDQLVITAADLKPDDRRAIAAGLRARGLPATDDAILAAYRTHLESLVHRGPQ